jgi:hypothetical protein
VELKRQTRSDPPAVIPPGCAGRAPRGPAVAPAHHDQSVLNGVYRVSWTDRELRSVAPVAKLARASFGGVITLMLQDGVYRVRAGTPPICSGRYAVSGDTVRFRVHPKTYCQGVVTARWSLAGGRLRLHVVSATNPYDRIIWGRKPWREIG